MDKGYLGIDESNHGKFPEIYVAVYTLSDIETAQRNNKVFNKKGRDKISLEHCLGKRKFKHIVFEEEYKKKIGLEGIKIVAISEFIKYFNNISKVVVDGALNYTTISYIKDVSEVKKIPSIIPAPKGDTKIEVVNIADNIANKLFKYYTHPITLRNKEDMFREHRIFPNLEAYISNLNSIGYSAHN